MAPPREQELEEEIELLKQQVSALMGSSRELGVLVALGRGMTHRTATILLILVNRAPAVISRDTLHSLIYGDRRDGGPEPKIFAVYVNRLRAILKRLECPGKIDTIWNAGYRANPELTKWVRDLYAANIPQEK